MDHFTKHNVRKYRNLVPCIYRHCVLSKLRWPSVPMEANQGCFLFKHGTVAHPLQEQYSRVLVVLLLHKGKSKTVQPPRVNTFYIFIPQNSNTVGL